MTRDFVIACAGAGKSRRIVADALSLSDQNKPTLILTYTENNQQELLKKIEKKLGVKPRNIDIKGWFAFLLEDLIRPYQKCIFPNRIMGLNFNERDPHKRNGTTIKGRKEKLDNGEYNWQYYVSSRRSSAHSTYLSKLAKRIADESKEKSIKRLAQIYSGVFIDEVQDLTGWDYEIIKLLCKSQLESFCCVGDFRQTVYTTHPTNKKPKTNKEKRDCFGKMGFQETNMNKNWRCCQDICNISDLVHNDENYEKTVSKLEEASNNTNSHTGVFVVRESDVQTYIDKYKPVILRHNKSVKPELCKSKTTYNFGASKGKQFDRTLILPTAAQKEFLSENKKAFESRKTDKAKNLFYVALTRAKFSVAIMMDSEKIIEGIKIYKP